MPIVLYQIPVSAPCRAVEMTAEHLGIELDKKHLDVFAGEQMKPEFLAINPQHCIPTIDDDGFILWESRAIQKYLINQYAPDSPLYPKDPKARAIVDKIMDYDLGSLFKPIQEFCHNRIVASNTDDPEKEAKMKKMLTILEKFLEKSPYAAGNHLTIADYSILGMLSFVEQVIEYSFGEFPQISAWLQRMKKETPKYKEINEIPLKEFKEYLKNPGNKLLLSQRAH